jgi:hypothetical protein
MDNNKRIIIQEPLRKNKKGSSALEKTNEPEMKIRKIISTKQSVFSESDFSFENQMNMLELIGERESGGGKANEGDHNAEVFSGNSKCLFVLQEIQKKIAGYRHQDKIKKIFDPEAFVDDKYVMELLINSRLNCFYCKRKTNVLYQQVRELSQWSLERIDNLQGHNRKNVEIACLSCNLSRKTMYHERFAFTKQMGEIIKLSK